MNRTEPIKVVDTSILKLAFCGILLYTFHALRNRERFAYRDVSIFTFAKEAKRCRVD